MDLQDGTLGIENCSMGNVIYTVERFQTSLGARQVFSGSLSLLLPCGVEKLVVSLLPYQEI